MLKFLWTNKIKVAVVVVAVLGYFFFQNRAAAAEMDRAPISVTQERLVEAGKIDLQYIYENSKYDASVTSTHGVDLKAGVFDWLTVGASTYYADAVVNSFGDITVYATADVGEILGFDIIPSVGISMPNGFNHHFAATDQISSGTYDLKPALALITDVGPVQLGAQWSGVYRLGTNDFGFAFGDENVLKGWASISPFKAVTMFAGVESSFVGTTAGLGIGDTSFETVLVGGGLRTNIEGFSVAGELYFPVRESYNATFTGINDQRVFRLSASRAF